MDQTKHAATKCTPCPEILTHLLSLFVLAKVFSGPLQPNLTSTGTSKPQFCSNYKIWGKRLMPKTILILSFIHDTAYFKRQKKYCQCTRWEATELQRKGSYGWSVGGQHAVYVCVFVSLCVCVFVCLCVPTSTELQGEGSYGWSVGGQHAAVRHHDHSFAAPALSVNLNLHLPQIDDEQVFLGSVFLFPSTM